MFDTEKTGTIPETVFRRIMTRKNGKIHQDFDEMMAAYKQVHCKSNPETPQGEEYIDYKGCRQVLTIAKYFLIDIFDGEFGDEK